MAPSFLLPRSLTAEKHHTASTARYVYSLFSWYIARHRDLEPPSKKYAKHATLSSCMLAGHLLAGFQIAATRLSVPNSSSYLMHLVTRK